MLRALNSKAEQFSGAIMGAALGLAVGKAQISFTNAVAFAVCLLGLFVLQHATSKLILEDNNLNNTLGGVVLYIFFLIGSILTTMYFADIIFWRESYAASQIDNTVAFILTVLVLATLVPYIPLMLKGAVDLTALTRRTERANDTQQRTGTQ